MKKFLVYIGVLAASTTAATAQGWGGTAGFQPVSPGLPVMYNASGTNYFAGGIVPLQFAGERLLGFQLTSTFLTNGGTNVVSFVRGADASGQSWQTVPFVTLSNWSATAGTVSTLVSADLGGFQWVGVLSQTNYAA